MSRHESSRLSALQAADATARDLAERLLGIAIRGLPAMHREASREYAYTRIGTTTLRGTSSRYAAIVALGARFLPEKEQLTALSGDTSSDLTELLVTRLPGITDLGDAALIAWAAAEHRHPGLSVALARLRALDADPRAARPVVESAWVVAALAAARDQADVESQLAGARGRLLGARRPGSPLFPHATVPGTSAWYREHVACFADQVYPIQALARLHASGGDAEALDAAEACAARICELQGEAGQWWWHYDARNGGLVEGYPVYSVHQHAMGPMALLDLGDAGGTDHGAAIRLGLNWMAEPPELAGTDISLIRDSLAVTWRKVYRGDPRKAVRAVQGLATRIPPGRRLSVLDGLLTPRSVDRECRPYEFGWMLYAWLGRVGPGADADADSQGSESLGRGAGR